MSVLVEVRNNPDLCHLEDWQASVGIVTPAGNDGGAPGPPCSSDSCKPMSLSRLFPGQFVLLGFHSLWPWISLWIKTPTSQLLGPLSVPTFSWTPIAEAHTCSSVSFWQLGLPLLPFTFFSEFSVLGWCFFKHYSGCVAGRGLAVWIEAGTMLCSFCIKAPRFRIQWDFHAISLCPGSAVASFQPTKRVLCYR